MNWTGAARTIVVCAILIALHYTLRPLLAWRASIDFLIVAFSVFLFIRQVNRFIRAPIVPSEKPPAARECPYCLSMIPARATRCAHCTSNLPAAA